MIPPPRRRSLPLQIAKWLALVWVVILFICLLAVLAGWGGRYYFQPLFSLLFLTLWPLAALLVWHWAASILGELRRIRRALDRIASPDRERKAL